MNVRQLREALDAYPDDLEILIARDAEGNGFHHLAETDVYFVVTEEIGYRIDDVYSDEDIEEEEMDREEMEPRLVFWP